MIITKINFKTNGNNFGRIPDAPEPLSDEWYESHCPKCVYNKEWQENGKWYACCEKCGCDFKEKDED